LFICLLSEEDFIEQHTWLENELSTTTKTWKVVFFHKPFFTTGSHANDMNAYRNTWWKAFDDYGVDLVIGAHTHYYLRSKPINLNVSSTSAVSEYGSEAGQGRLQVVAGRYGAPAASTGNAWFIEENENVLNYSKFEIDDNELELNTYNMAGAIIDNLTISKPITGIGDLESKNIPGISLDQNFPNPFNSSTTIGYFLPKSSYVILKIFSLSGQEIEILADGFQSGGKHQIKWQPKGLSSGTYYYRLEVSNSSNSKQKFVETKILIYQQ